MNFQRVLRVLRFFKGIERFHFAILEMTVKFFAIFSGILNTFLRIRMCLNIARFFKVFQYFFGNILDFFLRFSFFRFLIISRFLQ